MKPNCIYLDIGNTLVKSAVDQSGFRHFAGPFSVRDGNQLAEFSNMVKAEADQLVISSVVPANAQIIRDEIGDLIPIQHITVNDIDPGRLDYSTPQTLGIDRFLACEGAWRISGNPVVVIDAGTAVTVDFMDGDGVFRGGVIAPGLGVWEGGLKHYAPALPRVDRTVPGQWPGKSTKESLQWGLTASFVIMIEGLIKRYKSDWPDCEIWLSGGDTKVLSEYLDFELQIGEFLVFEGLKSMNLK